MKYRSYLFSQINIAAGFVTNCKENGTSSLHLIYKAIQSVQVTSTKYYQGRKSPCLYGPPYHVCFGFPDNSAKIVTIAKFGQQRLFLRLYADYTIVADDLFGSANFLVVMLNSGAKVDQIAYTEAHRKLLLAENESSKVR